jgi:hypothetical protein
MNTLLNSGGSTKSAQSHYIKLLPMLEPYVRSVVGNVSDWQQVLFDDLTEKGTRITYEVLPPGEGGPRIGISGDYFYCEAGRNARREGDSLFVYRVEPANRRFLSRVPTHLSATFLILTTQSNAPLLHPLPLGMLSSPERSASECRDIGQLVRQSCERTSYCRPKGGGRSEGQEVYRSRSFESLVQRKFYGRFAAVELGLLPDQFDRCREAANLLNQVLEAAPRPRGGPKLTLGLVKNINNSTADRLATEPIQFMYTLRNFDVHGRNMRPSDLLNRFSFRTPAQFKEATIEAAEQIAAELQLPSLPEPIELLL